MNSVIFYSILFYLKITNLTSQQSTKIPEAKQAKMKGKIKNSNNIWGLLYATFNTVQNN